MEILRDQQKLIELDR